MRNKIIQRIEVPHGNNTKICERFGVTQVTVRKALTYSTTSNLAESIRNAALKKFGGRIVYITEPHAQNL